MGFQIWHAVEEGVGEVKDSGWKILSLDDLFDDHSILDEWLSVHT